MNFIEENIDEIVFNLKLGELGTVVNSTLSTSCWIWFLHESLDAFVEDVCDRLHLRLLLGSHR